MLREKENCYAFAVSLAATKGQIREAVERFFKVDVESVRTMHVRGKLRRLGAHSGQRPAWKKALVRLKKGSVIKVESAP